MREALAVQGDGANAQKKARLIATTFGLAPYVVLADPQKPIDEFVADLKTHVRVSVDGERISHDAWAAPHKAKDLPIGSGAVYVFSLSSRIDSRAGQGRVLKVGKAGPNSNARFRYQHYKAGSAMSTLAGAIQNPRWTPKTGQ